MKGQYYSAMKVISYGHSCFSVVVAGKHLLFDPFITGNPLAAAVDAESVPADFILISHGHDDHMLDAIAIARRTGALVISNFEIVEWLTKQGLERLHAMNHGGAWEFEFGRVKLVNAVHSSMLPDGSYGGNPGGFVVETSEGSFYYSGDTALTLDMQLIPGLTPLRFAVLCIGDNLTMGIDDAIRAAEFVKCDQVLGVHYDTFPTIRISPSDAKARFKAKGKTLHLLKPGESFDL
jgi:L-ascorbate metabolism protein UlaG (beta-lactamase superfamily)